METFIFLVVGLIIGSFLNVVVVRLQAAETLLGRSFCRNCQGKIAWYDNIPLLSFALLRGECRTCRTKISWQYPVVEGLTGIVFALTGYVFFDPTDVTSWLTTGWLIGLFSIFMVIAVYDLRTMEIPVIGLVAAGLWTLGYLMVLSAGWDIREWRQMPLWHGLLGGALVAFFLFLLVFYSRETWMGWGDVWLGLVAGMAAGAIWSLVLLTLAFGIGAAVGLLSIATGKKTLRDRIPFAPFLVIATVLTLFLPRVVPSLEILSLSAFF